MNDLTTTYNAITAEKDKQQVAKSIYVVCRTITPQFYKKQTTDEMRVEITSIYLLTRNIRQDVLAKMCELSVDNYARARSKDGKTFFDINYMLTFYDEAWERARPAEFGWLYSIDYRGVVYCRLCDLDEQGRLLPTAETWIDERLST